MAYQASAAHFWQNAQYSDVQLQLCTVQQCMEVDPEPTPSSSYEGGGGGGADEAAPTPPGDKSSTGPAEVPHHGPDIAAAPLVTETAAAEGSSRTYHLHAVTLASASGHFRSLMPLRGVSATAAGGEQAAQRHFVEHVEEGELDAMDAVLRHCYTAQLCGNGEDVSQLGVGMLLQMMDLANRFDVPMCLAHACDELAERPAADHSVPSINAVLADLTTGWHGLAAFPRVVAAATERLLQLLGDTEAMCCPPPHSSDSSPPDQLLQLSLPSLLMLLNSKELKARSDNSVLALADAWVAGNPHCTVEQQRQVAAALRLGQLSVAFAFDVLPKLPWLHLSNDELGSLRRFVCAGDARGPNGVATAPSVQQGQLLQQTRHLDGPAAWYAAGPTGWPAQNSDLQFEWVMTTAQLAGHLRAFHASGACPTTNRVFFNGLLLHLALSFSRDDEGRPAAAHLCIQLCPAPSGDSARGSIPCLSVRLAAKVYVSEAADGGGGAYKGKAFAKFVSCGRAHALLDLEKVPQEQLLDVAGWAPYVVDGKLYMLCCVEGCY